MGTGSAFREECGGCGYRMDTSYSLRWLHEWMKREGWRLEGDQWFCPECQEKQNAAQSPSHTCFECGDRTGSLPDQVGRLLCPECRQKRQQEEKEVSDEWIDEQGRQWQVCGCVMQDPALPMHCDLCEETRARGARHYTTVRYGSMLACEACAEKHRQKEVPAPGEGQVLFYCRSCRAILLEGALGTSYVPGFGTAFRWEQDWTQSFTPSGPSIGVLCRSCEAEEQEKEPEMAVYEVVLRDKGAETGLDEDKSVRPTLLTKVPILVDGYTDKEDVKQAVLLEQREIIGETPARRLDVLIDGPFG